MPLRASITTMLCYTDVPDATTPDVRQRCKPATFAKLFHRVIQASNVKEPAMQWLHVLFTQHLHVVHCQVLPEVALTLWVFPQSPEAWSTTLKLLVQTLCPRVYVTAETHPTQHEVFMVVCTKPLPTTPAMFERWMNVFVEHIGMSAGHVCFGEYFGEQMLGSMMCIKKQFCVFHTMPNQFDRDFCLLFGALTQKRRHEAHARGMTGQDFTIENFVQLHLQNVRLSTQLRQQAKEKQTWAQRRSKLTRMICALGHVNAINMDTWKELLFRWARCPSTRRRRPSGCTRRLHEPSPTEMTWDDHGSLTDINKPEKRVCWVNCTKPRKEKDCQTKNSYHSINTTNTMSCSDARGNRTPNLSIWSRTRYHCATTSLQH